MLAGNLGVNFLTSEATHKGITGLLSSIIAAKG
jgi:hypothetical protein